MARLISICSNSGDDQSFFALRDDGCVYRCTLTSIGPVWERIGDAPNTKEGANLHPPTDQRLPHEIGCWSL
jgi:hypothetical protein